MPFDYAGPYSAADVMQLQQMLVPLVGQRGAAILGAYYGGAPSRDFEESGFFEGLAQAVVGDPQTYAEDAGAGLPYLPDDEPGLFEDDEDRGVKYYLAKLVESDPKLASVVKGAAEIVAVKKAKADDVQAMQDLSSMPAAVAGAVVSGAAAAGQTAAQAAGAVLDPLAKTAGETVSTLFESSGAAWLLLLAIVAALIARSAGVL